MSWFLVKVKFKMQNGDVIEQRSWQQGVDYIEAAEGARRDRQWDLRPHMKEGEFTHPEQVVSAEFSAKRYVVKELVSFDRGMNELTNKIYMELPGASREDIERLPYEPERAGWRGTEHMA